jgi:hypothetical protein
MDKSLANLTKLRREKAQISKIREEKGDITTNTNKIHRIIRENFENSYSSQLKNEEEMDKFLDAYNQPKLNQKYISHLNRPVRSNEIEAVKRVSTRN